MSVNPQVHAARNLLVDAALPILGGSTLLREDDPAEVAARLTATDVEVLRSTLHVVAQKLLGVLFEEADT